MKTIVKQEEIDDSIVVKIDGQWLALVERDIRGSVHNLSLGRLCAGQHAHAGGGRCNRVRH